MPLLRPTRARSLTVVVPRTQGRRRIWTGTIFDGTRGPMIATCSSWSSGAMGELARIGQVGRTGGDWTFQTMAFCDQQAHLICFEQ